VLADDEKRRAYDYQRTIPGFDRTFQQHQNQNGSDRVWPQHPSPSSSSRAGARARAPPQDPFSHPFFNNNNDDFFFPRPFPFPFGRSPFASFGWPFGGSRDPFGMEGFEDMMSSHRRMADELSRMAAQSQFQSQFQSSAANATTTRSFPPQPPPPQTTGQWSFMGGFNNAAGGDGGGRWVSESRSESWINGQRQTTHRRRDVNVRLCFPVNFRLGGLFSFLSFPFLFSIPVISWLRLLAVSPAASSSSLFCSIQSESRDTNRNIIIGILAGRGACDIYIPGWDDALSCQRCRTATAAAATAATALPSSSTADWASSLWLWTSSLARQQQQHWLGTARWSFPQPPALTRRSPWQLPCACACTHPPPQSTPAPHFSSPLSV
jgi:hypothetical protein